MYSSLSTNSDGEKSNLLQVIHPSTDPFDPLKFARPSYLSMGFMQLVIKLFMKPQDIVMDWTIGFRATYFSDDLSSHFILGLEDHDRFF